MRRWWMAGLMATAAAPGMARAENRVCDASEIRDPATDIAAVLKTNCRAGDIVMIPPVSVEVTARWCDFSRQIHVIRDGTVVCVFTGAAR